MKDLVFNYIVDEMKPLATCEKPSFQRLIRGLTSDYIVLPYRKALVSELNHKYKAYVEMLTGLIEKQSYVCVTADIWSSNNKSYLGMTCHFIDELNYSRYSYILACRRIKGNHNYLNIAKVINEIMLDFKIKNEKVTHVVTDNASNFGKAFRTFSKQFNVTDDTHISDSNYLGLISSDDSDSDVNISSDDDVNDSNLEFDVVDLSSLMLNHKETITNTMSLPSHLTCSAHTLNLIASVDTAKIVDQAYNSISKITFKKLSSFWNLLSRSTVVSDKVFDLCSCKFPVPNLTRWNSMYDAVHKVVTNKQNLVLVFNELKIKKMKKNEWSFLEEYCKVMSPLAISLDKLQGERSCHLGFVAPTILALRLLLIQMNNFVHCRPLCFNIISSLEKRFDYILDLKKVKSKSFILSAISHPKFKLSWVPDRYKSYCKQIFFDEIYLINTDKDAVLNTDENVDSDNSDQEFFQVLSENCLDVDIDIQSNHNCINAQAMEYLNSKNKDFSVLNSFPIIKKIFFKYNTTLPSSAPVERLFSSGSQIMTPRRNRLNDKTFEMLLCCRCQNLNSNNF